MQNILIIGCGRVANHYKYLSKDIFSKKNKVIAVCDIDQNKAKKFGNFFGCAWFTKYEEAITQKKPTLIIVLTPSGYHYKIAMYCLKRKVNTVVEKPMAMTIRECEKLINYSKKNNLFFGTIYQNRFNPSVIYMKNLMDKGAFGKVITANVRLRWARYQDYYEDGWHGTWKNDGGVINQQCTHHIDILNQINGPIIEVCGYGLNALNKLEAEDTMTAIFKFKNNSTGTLEATTAARPHDIEATLSITAEKGYFEIGGVALNELRDIHLIDKKINKKKLIKDLSEKVPGGYGLSHKRYFKKLFDNLDRNIIRSPVDNESALETTKIIHALYLSDEKNSWIKVDNKSVSNRLGKSKGKGKGK